MTTDTRDDAMDALYDAHRAGDHEHAGRAVDYITAHVLSVLRSASPLGKSLMPEEHSAAPGDCASCGRTLTAGWFVSNPNPVSENFCNRECYLTCSLSRAQDELARLRAVAEAARALLSTCETWAEECRLREFLDTALSAAGYGKDSAGSAQGPHPGDARGTGNAALVGPAEAIR